MTYFLNPGEGNGCSDIPGVAFLTRDVTALIFWRSYQLEGRVGLGN